jgi:hypothetical protein
VAIVDPKTYRTFIIPIPAAEDLVLRTYREWRAHPTRAGTQRKVVRKVYLSAAPDKPRELAGARSREIYEAATKTLVTFEDSYDNLLLGEL